MKPAPFAYSAPTSVEEAVSELARLGHDGKVLAGGQSLLPLLSMRLASPRHLVDINRLPGLGRVEVDQEAVEVGALARHSQVLNDETAYGRQPLLRQALSLVAHPTIRNRGTTVGSIAHADPAGEMTAVTALLEAVAVAVSTQGVREIPAADLFVGPLETSLREGELLQAVRFRARRAGEGTAFVESARRHGDYALVGVAALVQLGEGRVEQARAAYISVSTTPLVLDLTAALAGCEAAVLLTSGADRAAGTGGPLRAAGELARSQVEPEADIHASAQYRRQLVEVLTARALHHALQHAVDLVSVTTTANTRGDAA